MHMVVRMTLIPFLHLLCFVGSVIVHDQMHFRAIGYGVVDPVQKLQKFLMAVTAMALSDHVAGLGVERPFVRPIA